MGGVLQPVVERGKQTPNLRGELARGQDRLEADVSVGVLQQRQEARHGRQQRTGDVIGRTRLRPLKRAVMAEGDEPVREGRVRTEENGPKLPLHNFCCHETPPAGSPAF
jgi:hypothetical protein